jgi:hypothetical protein
MPTAAKRHPSKRPMAVFAAVSVGLLAIIATTGCAYLLFGPCGMYGCPRNQVMSLPPRDNPLALALSTRTDQERVESILNAVVNAQSGAPANTSCAEAAVAGCRYSILLQTVRGSPTMVYEEKGCSLLEVAVEGRTRSGPRIGSLRYRPTTCPAAIPSNRPTE